MSRPRLSSGDRRRSTSLTLSPNVVVALDRVRGVRSQAVYVEECLRRDRAIAEELRKMADTGFSPPVSRYEQLVDALMEFYHPDRGDMQEVLAIAHKIIMRDTTSTDREIIERISAAMLSLWKQDRTKGRARGESIDAVLPAIQQYGRLYYEMIFQQLAEGERALLQSRFRSVVRGCEAVYQERRSADAQ